MVFHHYRTGIGRDIERWRQMTKSLQATAAALGVFVPSGLSVVMVSFLSQGPAPIHDLFR
jgi:hypothetical protein